MLHPVLLGHRPTSDPHHQSLAEPPLYRGNTWNDAEDGRGVTLRDCVVNRVGLSCPLLTAVLYEISNISSRCVSPGPIISLFSVCSF